MSDTLDRTKALKRDAGRRRLLALQQNHLTREHGIERVFTGPYWNERGARVYTCVCCGMAPFRSETKYDPGTGRPSDWQPLSSDEFCEHEDRPRFPVRAELRCASFDGHLAPVFKDGVQGRTAVDRTAPPHERDRLLLQACRPGLIIVIRTLPFTPDAEDRTR